MKRSRFTLLSLLTALVLTLALAPAPVAAQAYPARPVKIIVATGAGSAADAIGRLVAKDMSESWGKPVYVENIPGAGGAIGTEAMIRAAPDGYTLGVIGTQHMINRAFYPNLAYDSVKELRGVISLVSSVIVLVATPSLGVNSARELIDMAKAKPSVIDFGSSGNGGLLQLVVELFNQEAGIKMTHVPYGALPKMMTDLLAGRIGVAAATGTTAVPLMKAGRLKVLAVARPQRSPLFPDVPTGAEIGLPNFSVSSWNGLATPAKTPDAIVDKLYTEINTVARKPEFEVSVGKQGFELSVHNGEQTWKRVNSEVQMWTKLVQDAKLKPE